MSRGYLFIANSTKPSQEVYESIEPIGPSSFSRASIWAADKCGWKLHMGINRKYPDKIRSNGYDISFYDQNSYRNIFEFKEIWKAYRNLVRYLKDNPEIEIIHCNTPIGGLVGRLAGKRFKKKVIYTAHGFHFFKSAPLFNRTILKWIEIWLAKMTDVIITINDEDYRNALKLPLKSNGRVEFVPGVGVDVPPISFGIEKVDRTALDIPTEAMVCICMGDLVKRKNHDTIIRAIAKTQDPNIHLLVCGVGPEMNNLRNLSMNLGIDSQIHFLGFRKDIPILLNIADCFLFSSLQEGLPRSTMEAMSYGLPAVVSNIRGNNDLIKNKEGGYLLDPKDINGFAEALIKLKNNPDLRQSMGRVNKETIKHYDLDTVKNRMLEIFMSM